MGKSKPSGDYLGTLRRRYAAASKKERGVILDELVKTSGYHRKHASALLCGRRLHRQGPIRRPRARVPESPRHGGTPTKTSGPS